MVIVEVKTFQYINYIPSQQEMYIKCTKILLTQFESTFVSYLLDNNGYCNMSNFQQYISRLNRKSLYRKSLVVGVNRLRKKIVYQTGYDVIKSKYGFGYNINI